MIKLLLYIAGIAAISGLFMMALEYDGQIVAQVSDYQIQLNVSLFLTILVVLIITIVTAIQLVLWIKNIPQKLARKRQEQKHKQGITALTEGFAAIAAGDSKKAIIYAKKIEENLGATAISNMLSAQASQLSGDDKKTKQFYSAMLEDKQTELIALKGLLVQARKEGNIDFALYLAKKACSVKPHVIWAPKMLVDLYKQNKDWDNMLSAIESALNKRSIEPKIAARMAGVIYYIKAENEYVKNNSEAAQKFILSANKNISNFPPIILQQAKISRDLQSGVNKTLKNISGCWSNKPHPDLREAFLLLNKDIKTDKLVKLAEKLVKNNPSHLQSRILVSKCAMEAGDYNKARNNLKIAINEYDVAELYNLIAEAEKLDIENQADLKDNIAKWHEKSLTAMDDPSWLCETCGYTSPNWADSCYHCKSFDSFNWQEKKVINVSHNDNINEDSMVDIELV
jgi:HemY protein